MTVAKRRVEVTFDTALPCGTIGRFTLDKELWVAVPHTKYRRLTTVIDRLIGHNARVRRELIRWINAWPDDAVRVAAALGIVSSAEELGKEIVEEKMRAQIS